VQVIPGGTWRDPIECHLLCLYPGGGEIAPKEFVVYSPSCTGSVEISCESCMAVERLAQAHVRMWRAENVQRMFWGLLRWFRGT